MTSRHKLTTATRALIASSIAGAIRLRNRLKKALGRAVKRGLTYKN